MEIINIREIDFNDLQKMPIQGTQGSVFAMGDKCVKMLDRTYPEDNKKMYRKFLSMDGIKVPNVIMPQDLIVKDGKLVGYTMENFKNSINVFDYFDRFRYVSSKHLFEVIKECSKILKNIHNNGIICQDVTLDNILINEDGVIKYSDIDSCTYKGISSQIISLCLKNFLYDYKKEKDFIISENTDRISFILSFYYMMYFNELQNIKDKQYNKLSNHIQTLEDMKVYVRDLLKYGSQAEMPYMDEVINDNEDYVIDRKNVLTLSQKIFGRF